MGHKPSHPFLLEVGMSEGVSKGPWVNKEHEIEVYETFHDFQIKDMRTGECRGMGDGVDMFGGDPDDPDGQAVMVGTDEFYRLMGQMVESEGATLREAYFGR
jgi:hypothetical protein